ncbi:MAG: TraB/VirB10 family protein [Holosporales bacterium]
MFKKIFTQEGNDGRDRSLTIIRLSVCGLLFFLVFGLSLWRTFGGALSDPQTDHEDAKPKVVTAADVVSPDAVWRHKAEEEIRKTQEKIAELHQDILKKDDESPIQTQETVQLLLERIDNLERAVHENQNTNHNAELSSQGNEEKKLAGIRKVSFALKPQKSKSLRTIDNFIPAGAFAKASLLSGVDATSALNASANPQPVLLRITNTGTLPRRFKGDMEGCFVTAGAYGDLSSERVFVRLEKLTCTERATGEIIETTVAGYVAGPDGKSGIRGTVVFKDGEFISRAFVGGILSGLGAAASPRNRMSIVNPFSAGNPIIQAPSFGETLTSGVYEGASNSSDRLAKYYIERAEQIQPIVSVPSGLPVDVIFTTGVEIGGTTVREELSRTRDDARREAAHQHANDAQSAQ